MRQLSMKFPWVRGTALGLPVVPDVAKMTASSSLSGTAGLPVKAVSGVSGAAVTQGHCS